MKKILVFLMALIALTSLTFAKDGGFEFRLVCPEQTKTCEKLYDIDNSTEVYVNTNILLSNKDVNRVEIKELDPLASVHQKQGLPLKLETRVYIYFTKKGKEKLLKITKENVNQRLAILFNGEFLWAPVIFEPIQSGRIELVNLTKEKAQSIAQQVNLLKK